MNEVDKRFKFNELIVDGRMLLCPYCGYNIVTHETKVNNYDESNFQPFCKINSAHKITQEVLDASPDSCFILSEGNNLAEIKIIYSTVTDVLFFNIINKRGIRTSYPFIKANDVINIVISSINKEETRLLYEYNKNHKFITNNLVVEQKLVGEEKKKIKRKLRNTYEITFKISNLEFPGFVFKTTNENVIYKFVYEFEKYKNLLEKSEDDKTIKN